MADTTFTDKQTTIVAAWLNDVNRFAYTWGRKSTSLDAMSASLRAAVIARTVTSANAAEITTALLEVLDDLPATGGTVEFIDGLYYLNDELTLDSFTTISMNSNVRIDQTVDNKRHFIAANEDQVCILANGALLYGQGTYSSSWTSMGGHLGRAIQFTNCTRSGIYLPVIKNCGNAGIAIAGGDRITIVAPSIEGTNDYSTPISANDNFQVGIWLNQNSTDGPIDNLRIIAPDISGATQGIVLDREADVATGGKNRVIVAPVIHDIPGQHGLYLSDGQIAVSTPVIDTVELNAIKIQGDDGRTLENFVITGFDVSNCTNDSALSISVPVSGAIRGLKASGVAHDVLRGVSIDDRVSDCQIEAVIYDATQHGVLLQGVELHDIDITISAHRCGRYGVLVQCTSSDGIRIRPVVREANTSVGAFDGIRIDSSDVELFDPVATDADGNQVYGLNVTGGNVKVWRSAELTGASSYGATAATPLLAWPDDTIISGTTGAYQNISNFTAPNPPKFRPSTIPVGGVAYGSLGTNTTPVAGTIYWAEVEIPQLASLTGVGFLNGGTVGTDAAIVALYDNDGTLVANSALAGVTTSGTDAFQQVAFTAAYQAKKGRYFIAVQFNGTTTRFRTITASTYINTRTDSDTGVFGTLTALTVPSTFTADVGPIAYVY